MGASFEPFAEVYVPILLKGTVVTIQVISLSSLGCARSIILYSTPVKCLPKLLTSLSDRSSTIRKNAMECVLLLLDALPACESAPTFLSDPLSPFINLWRWALNGPTPFPSS